MKMHIAAAGALLAMALTGLADTTANLTISGSVADRTAIAAAPQGRYNTLPIEAGCTDEVVAQVTETSNNRAGYTVTLSSANAGSGTQATLNGTGANTDTVGYSMKYAGATVSLSGGAAVVTTSSSRTPRAGTVKSLAVTIPQSWVTQDTYSDTLTLTIKAN